jgi:hypothetical protein
MQLSQGPLSLSSCDDYIALFWNEMPQPYSGLVLILTSALFIALTIFSTFHLGKIGFFLSALFDYSSGLKLHPNEKLCTTASLFSISGGEFPSRFEHIIPWQWLG